MGKGHKTEEGRNTGIEGTQQDSVLGLEGGETSQTVKQSTSDDEFTR